MAPNPKLGASASGGATYGVRLRGNEATEEEPE